MLDFGCWLMNHTRGLDFEKKKAAVAVAARHHYRGLTWLGTVRRAGGAPALVLALLPPLLFRKILVGSQCCQSYL